MVRKPTWILLGVFAVLLAAVLYLQRNPIPAGSSATPSPTAPAAVITGIAPADITVIERRSSQGGDPLRIAKDAQGNWFIGVNPAQAVATGKAEQIKAELGALQSMGSLETDYSLEAVGLSAPQEVLALSDAQGKKVELRIGGPTPTGTGIYVQVDNQAPVVVRKGAVETILGLLSPELLVEQVPVPVEQTPVPVEQTPVPVEQTPVP